MTTVCAGAASRFPVLRADENQMSAVCTHKAGE